MVTKYSRNPQRIDLTDPDTGTTESPWSFKTFMLSVALVGAGIGFFFAVFLIGAALDERAANDHKTLVQLTKTEQVSQALPTKLAEAYERGLTDAMQSLNGTPQGVALAQACLAAGMGGRP